MRALQAFDLWARECVGLLMVGAGMVLTEIAEHLILAGAWLGDVELTDEGDDDDVDGYFSLP